ncbi:protein pigeon isoform X2 [Tribolium madens]|uniref:protein pigeon isoform X2 n=1 Tax=Tribolium madens TaxID=41895 RepID=UPI001CF72E84|nr:protein pigeon isoform X2 [Tribolium madens]
MVTVDNFASKLCSIILGKNPEDEANEWRLLGQEQDETLLFSWVQSSKTQKRVTKIGLYSFSTNDLTIIHTFECVVNCIQASIDSSKTFLAYVIKKIDPNDTKIFTYNPYLLKIGTKNKICDLDLERSKQILVQFLYQKHSVLSENSPVKFLILIHQECILQYQIKNENELNAENFVYESLVRKFTWAQWDPIHQTLYYIHNRKPTRCLVEGEEETPSLTSKTLPTLSGLQFHDDLPHESVLNIPLNLPHLSTVSGSCGIYEDDCLPLRIHDCSLDLIVLTNSNGYVCVCHHYLYQPIQPTTELKDDDTSLVHFAYSVTVLHQSCVIHCVVPGLPWSKAKTIRPLFKYHGDHMLVFIPEVCTHLLDIGAMHEPCCHVITKPLLTDETYKMCLTSLVTIGNEVINLATLDLIDMTVPTSLLVQTFKSNAHLGNKLSIIHYLILHRSEIETVSELISWQAEKPLSLGLSQLLREFLIGSSYASVQRNLPSDASHLVNLLPLTTQHMGNELEVRINNKMICLSQDVLWNASMMLLSPQQRIVPYRSDIWVKLWDQLARISKGKQRFRPTQVVEKLLVSLVCYQPEALSRSSTPMSPTATLGSSAVLNDFLSIGNQCRKSLDALPFYEIESCTASKQEHIISVNLRELSMHLLKQSAENKISKFQWQSQTPMHVHAVATRYITAQLEQSRYLCQILCKAATFDPRQELEKGFVYIEQLQEERRYILFTILERYYLSVESIAFPLPQGFTSFFAFLGYKTLSFDMFLQYIQRNVLELQVDVMKIIMADIDNCKNGLHKKLKLLTLLPRSRAKRLLNQWNHPVSLMLRAREHAFNVLSGVDTGTARLHGIQKNKAFRGLTAFPSGERLSPLDTFLDLLTAKASLTELDFGLLIEATETSTEEFL